MHCHFRALALAVDAALLPYMHLSPDKQFSDVITLVATVFNHATHLQTGGGCGGGATVTAADAFACLPPLPLLVPLLQQQQHLMAAFQLSYLPPPLSDDLTPRKTTHDEPYGQLPRTVVVKLIIRECAGTHPDPHPLISSA